MLNFNGRNEDSLFVNASLFFSLLELLCASVCSNDQVNMSDKNFIAIACCTP